MIRTQISIFLALILLAAGVFADEKIDVKVGPGATLMLMADDPAFMLTTEQQETGKNILFTRTIMVRRNNSGLLEIQLTETTRALSQPTVRVREAYLLVTGTAEKHQAEYVTTVPRPFRLKPAKLEGGAAQNLFRIVGDVLRFLDLVQKNMSMLPAQTLFNQNEGLKKDVSAILNVEIWRYVRVK